MPGIDTEHFRPMQKDESLLQKFSCEPEDLIVLFVANLYREKGIFDLLYAFRKVVDSLGPERKIRLLIAGKGREEARVATTITQLRLERHARLIGSFGYDDMPKVHNLADVFVLPSIPVRTWQEQFGYVLIESMACGKPVVSTTSGSIPEVVGDAGILVPANDFVSLADTIESLVTDGKKRSYLGQRGRTRVEKMFDANKVAESLRSHYHSLLRT
jgi:glycosyltransferase involved in cell wall biosynthesis